MNKILYDKDNSDINSNQTYKLNNNYLNNNNKQNVKKIVKNYYYIKLILKYILFVYLNINKLLLKLIILNC